MRRLIATMQMWQNEELTKKASRVAARSVALGFLENSLGGKLNEYRLKMTSRHEGVIQHV